MSEKNKDIQNRSKRIASNTLVLFARMLIITFVNLYTVRWVLAGLGTEDYGIFNAVAGVVTASTCISSVLALSTQRFYSFAMGKGESDRLKEIFSVSLNIVVLIALVLLVLFEIVGPWLILWNVWKRHNGFYSFPCFLSYSPSCRYHSSERSLPMRIWAIMP